MTPEVQQPGFKYPAKERGAVLFISLIMLLLITLVSFSVMETSTLEAQLATASEQKAISFQMAEASVSEATNSMANLNTAYSAWLADESNPSWPSSNHALTGYNSGQRVVSATGSSETRFLGNATTIGYSIRKGSAGLETYYYEAEASTSLASSDISNTHIQGVYVEAPRTN
jgi:type IV pilus assembly protein PilX